MIEYEFMNCREENIRNIRKHAKEKYGIEIDAETLHREDEFDDLLKRILNRERNKRSKDIAQLKEIGDEEEDKEGIYHLKDMVSDLEEEIWNVSFYIPDLYADCLMGLFWSDTNYKFGISSEMEQGWGQSGENAEKGFKKGKESENYKRIKNVQKYYPFARYGDDTFPMSGIPGGCREYHQLMMQQKNIGIFDINADTEENLKTRSFKRYAFPKTHDIYQELKNSPIENLLLLEKTQGIGYTNQLFSYMYAVTKKEELDKFRYMVKLGTELPMFIRKNVLRIVCRCISYLKNNDSYLSDTEELIECFSCIITSVYKELLELSWYVFYLAYWGDKGLGFNLPLILEQYWKEYFSENEVYQIICEKEKLHDWRNIEKVEDCFRMKGETGFRILYNAEYLEIVMKDDIVYRLMVESPISKLGKDIQEETAKEVQNKIWVNKEIQEDIQLNIELQQRIKEAPRELWDEQWEQYEKDIEKNNKRLRELYYKTRKEVFEKKRKEEQKIWNKEIKVGADKLKPSHVYAIIHADIIKFLNE